MIIGDANMSEIATYLKMGSTALVLAMIEDGFLTDDFSIEGPVAALRAVSHDSTLSHRVTLRDGRKMTGIQVQMEYLEQARKYVEDRFGADADDVDARRARAVGVGARRACPTTRCSCRPSLTGLPSCRFSRATAIART